MKRLKISVFVVLSVLHDQPVCAQDDGDSSAVVANQSNSENNSQASVTDSTDSMPTDPKDAAQYDIDDMHEKDLSTLDIEGSGNWLKKRIIYQQAQIEFDEVLALVNKVVDMRMQFSNEVSLIGHKIDDFYEVVDFDKGELDNKLKSILADLDMEQKLRGDLSEKESELQIALKQQLSVIEQLGQNIKSIGDLDRKLDQVLMQAFKTIDECRDYETKSWASFKAIAKEIDDKKARSLYYEINNFKQNIDQKRTYLDSSLLPYLHNILIAKIESNIAKIKDTIEQLKQKGVDLSAIMKVEQASDLTLVKQREEESATLAVDKALQVEREKEEQDKKIQAQSLEKKHEATWSYKLSQVGDMIGVTYLTQQFKVYKDPVASYMLQKWQDFTGFMHGSMQGLMNYFKPTLDKKDQIDKVETSSKVDQAMNVVTPIVDEQQ